jgi:acetyl-CoA acyltransferase
MMGNAPSLSPSIFERDGDVGIAYGMGLTAEKVAQQWKVSREAQDAFALESHRRAIARSRPASSRPRSRRSKSPTAR